MNVIISGADGFVGSHVLNRFLSEGHKVLAIDIAEKPKRIDLSNKSVIYISSPINKLNNFLSQLKSFKPDVVYHFAWKGSAGPLREDFSCQINNAIETLDFLKLSSSLGAKKFVMAGSIAEFEIMDVMYKDNSVPPKSCYYGMGKQLAHELCKPIASELNIDLIWAYITNAYGVGENSPRLINNVIKKIIAKEDFNFSSGIQNYDFLYIDDVAEAFYLLGLKGIKNKGYLIGSGKAKPLKEFIKEIYDVAKATSKPIFGETASNTAYLPLNIFNTSNLFSDVGFRPKYSFSEGIKKTIDWLKLSSI